MNNQAKNLIAGLHSMGIRKEATMVVLLLLKTESQMERMMDWMALNYQNNPTDIQIVRVAEKIAETVN